MVFSWVDGSASEFQQRSARAQQEEHVVGRRRRRARPLPSSEYCGTRCAACACTPLGAPHLHRHRLAAANAWLPEHPRVTVVHDEEFFADPSVLPTHNSHAVEAQLHRIDGLAEHFLYSNDDMFFGRPVTAEMFFTAGASRSSSSATSASDRAPRARNGPDDNAARVNRELLRERFGRVILRDLELLCGTDAAKRGRGGGGASSPTTSRAPRHRASRGDRRLRPTACITTTRSTTGEAIATTEPRVRYVQTTMASALKMRRLEAAPRRADMFCLNDGGETEVPEELRVRMLRDARADVPVRAPWERPPAHGHRTCRRADGRCTPTPVIPASARGAAPSAGRCTP
jgi:hypothetical protein